jgi:creatinine amidohydrolase
MVEVYPNETRCFDPGMNSTGGSGRALSDLRAPEWAEMSDACLLLPLGSTEQHGPHLPMGTDTQIAVAICQAAADRSSKVVLAPPIPFGASQHHKSLPGGSISVLPRLLADYLVCVLGEIVGSGRSVVVVNTHGGNWSAVTCAIDTLGAEQGELPAAACCWWHLVPDLLAVRKDVAGAAVGHAGAIETSIVLAQRRGQVKVEDAPLQVSSPPGAQELDRAAPVSVYMWHDFGRYTRTGVFGAPREADEEFGRQLVDVAGDRLVRVAEMVRTRVAERRGR